MQIVLLQNEEKNANIYSAFDDHLEPFLALSVR